MAENQDNGQEIPRWRQAQDDSIRKATTLIKEFGINVQFLVIKDRKFLEEIVRPTENIDEAMDFLYRLEGRGISSEDIANFRREYSFLCEQFKAVENIAVELLAKAKVRTTNQNLNRKIQRLRNKKVEPEKQQEVQEEIKEDKKEEAKKEKAAS